VGVTGPSSGPFAARHPILTRPRANTLCAVNDRQKRLTQRGLTLLSAAERLEQDADDRACATVVPAALARVELALRP
jgi:hypothetical protein